MPARMLNAEEMKSFFGKSAKEQIPKGMEALVDTLFDAITSSCTRDVEAIFCGCVIPMAQGLMGFVREPNTPRDHLDMAFADMDKVLRIHELALQRVVKGTTFKITIELATDEAYGDFKKMTATKTPHEWHGVLLALAVSDYVRNNSTKLHNMAVLHRGVYHIDLERLDTERIFTVEVFVVSCNTSIKDDVELFLKKPYDKAGIGLVATDFKKFQEELRAK